MKLEELEVYQAAMGMAEQIWILVAKWEYFSKDTVGKQLVRAADSVAANLSEGYGRFHYIENRQFSYYSRESLYETRTWLTKAYNRSLLAQEDFSQFIVTLDTLGRRLNAYINSIGPKQPMTNSQ